MTIIADSGSTKTTWMEVESGNKIVTEGLNPHFTSDDAFLAACSAVRNEMVLHSQLSTLNSTLSSLHFYGAGCGNATQRERVALLLSKAFGISNIHVETDMLGACRAVCGHEAGLVGILGTGSNACHYDGNRITHQPFSTGYILGDHGSANHVGRRLLQDYLSGIMPQHLSTMFHDTYPLGKEQFIDHVYHQPNANRYLASLAPFAVQHLAEDYCHRVVYDSLADWYRYQLAAIVDRTGCRRLSLVGSYAAHIEPVLCHFAADHGLTLCSVPADPIDGLRRYHSI